MPIRKLFLSHFSGDALEVRQLGVELRVRGIAPWVDKDGGFKVGDHSPTEARRAIRHDCFGLLFYATRDAFNRDFIRDVEIDEAKRVHGEDAGYLLFAVPRGLTFDELAAMSVQAFAFNLSPYHTIAIGDDGDLPTSLMEVARGVLAKVLSVRARSTNVVSLQFSTRELLPDRDDDLLRIDGTHLASAISNGGAWEAMLRGLRDVKQQVAAAFGRPVLYVHGSKHLASAFAFGRVFAPFELRIQETANAVWRTDENCPEDEPLAVSHVIGDGSSTRLFVEIASRLKNISAGVDAHIASSSVVPALRLQFRPPSAPLNVDNSTCLAMVRQVYDETERAMQQHRIDEVHLFVAAPQSFMMMLGRAFRGMPDTYLYEWSGTTYQFAGRVEAGVL
jgi:hypothetical protein